jgi:hypothetical protein
MTYCRSAGQQIPFLVFFRVAGKCDQLAKFSTDLHRGDEKKPLNCDWTSAMSSWSAKSVDSLFGSPVFNAYFGISIS